MGEALRREILSEEEKAQLEFEELEREEQAFVNQSMAEFEQMESAAPSGVTQDAVLCPVCLVNNMFLDASQKGLRCPCGVGLDLAQRGMTVKQAKQRLADVFTCHAQNSSCPAFPRIVAKECQRPGGTVTCLFAQCSKCNMNEFVL